MPARVELSAALESITAGQSHTCARARDGRGWCWGRNIYGQLGDGTTEDRNRPTTVRGVAAFTALSASGAHTCGAGGGDTYCWGYNIDGQLGVGDRENAASPGRVGGAR